MCSKSDFITSHAAFGYLASTYKLRQIAIAGLSPDAEPSAQQMADIAKFAKNNGVKIIFFESLVSPELSQTLAREVGAQTLVLDPIEGLTDNDIQNGKDYFTQTESNLSNLKIALECKQ
jgi:zinc transport system substrate-binding protein